MLILFLVVLASLRGSEGGTPAFGPQVAVVEIEGMILDVEDVVRDLRRHRDNPLVRAVVIRINSPGGVVGPTQEVYDAIRRVREAGKPVVASLGAVAASGGYYIACAADRIVAHPTTMTGSIGVIMLNFNVEGLLGKIGVRNETFKAGEHKDLLSPLRGATPEERRIVQSILDSLHARFVSVVRESRPKLDAARITELTDGRIFDASQALAAGLVDAIGSLRDAVAIAQKAAGLEKARVIMYRRSDERRENLYSSAGGPAQVNMLAVDLAAVAGDGPRFMYLWAPGLLR